ncbi:MAG: Wadjet anti-phage system protein JetD domain-containing protein [Candidatus Weimeria sp.]
MRKVTLEELLKSKQNFSYQEQYEYIRRLLDLGGISPMKSSPMNGKNPPLPLRYWIATEEKDKSAYLSELKYGLNYRISPDYYLHHISVYEKDRKYVLMLSEYLNTHEDALKIPVSENERSFDIWHLEKFFQKSGGFRILKNCGMTREDMNYYTTQEPLAYYSASREPGTVFLFVENKDTFFSIRRILIEKKSTAEILGVPVSTVIYGSGKGIWKSIEDFESCVEEYMTDVRNSYLYFGDIDYEGIGIYDNLRRIFTSSGRRLLPFTRGYQRMVEKAVADGTDEMPFTKEKQNRNIDSEFFSHFDTETAETMKSLLESDRYIPQEIVNVTDFLGR